MPPKRKSSAERPLVGIMLGSASDLAQVEPAKDILKEFGVPFELKILSAHRTPDHAHRYAAEAESIGLEVIMLLREVQLIFPASLLRRRFFR